GSSPLGPPLLQGPSEKTLDETLDLVRQIEFAGSPAVGSRGTWQWPDQQTREAPALRRREVLSNGRRRLDEPDATVFEPWGGVREDEQPGESRNVVGPAGIDDEERSDEHSG